MAETPESPVIYRFGEYTLDLLAYELRHRGRSVRLERRPMELLQLLVERRGQLVARAEIVDRLWGQDVFVETETAVNTVVWKLRGALRDSAETPAFVETVPAKGYRFVAPVQVVARDQTADGTAVVNLRAALVTAAPTSEMVVTPLQSNGEPPSQERPVATKDADLQRASSAESARSSWLAALLVAAPLIALTVGSTLWRWSGVTPQAVTVGVLPFEIIGGASEWDYLADGLSEETIASLGQLEPDHLRVIGRTTMMGYKQTRKPLAEIGRELRVDYLVENSIRAGGDRLRITVRLIRAADQVQVWSASFDRQPTSMLGVQREVSAAIAGQVLVRLRPESLNAADGRQTLNGEAYDAYLRGRYFENRRNPESVQRAVQLYVQAVQQDPDYALAWAGLAFTYAASALNSDAPPREVWPRAREAAGRAVRANPNLSEAQFAVGYVNWLLDWDWPAAEAAMRRAVALDPSNATALRTLGHVLSQRGRHAEADLFMRQARELDPFAAMSHVLSSQVAFQARASGAAAEHAKRAILIDSRLWIGSAQLAQALGDGGETELALSALDDAARFSGGENSITMSLRGYLLATAKRTNEAHDVLRRLEATSRTRYVPPYAMALVHNGLGDRDAAFDWLQRAFTARDVQMIFLPVDPKWDGYRNEARFQQLIRDCGFI
jgi:TolB-like protein/DNA-binding winged helix-turn-helix (wHTH) protein/Tfp pilus assembly protein PilF